MRGLAGTVRLGQRAPIKCGISLMVKQQISNLRLGVRFSYPAPFLTHTDK